MNEVFAVADHDVGTLHQSTETAGLIVGHDQQPAAVALDFDGLASGEHLVEYSVDVLPQFRCRERHIFRVHVRIDQNRTYV